MNPLERDLRHLITRTKTEAIIPLATGDTGQLIDCWEHLVELTDELTTLLTSHRNELLQRLDGHDLLPIGGTR